MEAAATLTMLSMKPPLCVLILRLGRHSRACAMWLLWLCLFLGPPPSERSQVSACSLVQRVNGHRTLAHPHCPLLGQTGRQYRCAENVSLTHSSWGQGRETQAFVSPRKCAVPTEVPNGLLGEFRMREREGRKGGEGQVCRGRKGQASTRPLS